MSTHSSLGRDCIWGIEKTNVFGLRCLSSSHDFRVTFFKTLGLVFWFQKKMRSLNKIWGGGFFNLKVYL